MRVLFLTSEWPTDRRPWAVPFLVRQVRFLREAGLDVDVFPFKGRRNLKNYVAIYRRLQKHLNRQHYDVLHGQFGHSGLLAGLPKRAPLVVTFQGTDLHGIYTAAGRYHPVSHPLRLLMQLVACRADEVIVVSEHLGSFLWRKDCHLIPGGLDLDLFKPMPQDEARRRLGLPVDEPLVLFVGNPQNAVKRHHLAAAVMQVLSLTLPAQLLLLNGVQPELVPVYMNAADVLLVTSKHEGSPNAVKEALACNLPVVSVDVGDIRRRLANVSNCCVVPSEAPMAIAQALVQVLRQRQRCNGRESVQELNEALLVQRQIQVYESAVRRHVH